MRVYLRGAPYAYLRSEPAGEQQLLCIVPGRVSATMGLKEEEPFTAALVASPIVLEATQHPEGSQHPVPNRGIAF